MNLIASSIPGRLRLRDRAWRDAARLDELGASVTRWRDVLRVEANPKAGSLLIHYDATKLERVSFEARVTAIAAKTLAGRSTLPAGAASRRHGSRRVRANRLAKRGMLASLALSMLLAAAGAKRWHALTGVVFLHALGVHLWVHRHHLVR